MISEVFSDNPNFGDRAASLPSPGEANYLLFIFGFHYRLRFFSSVINDVSKRTVCKNFISSSVYMNSVCDILLDVLF